MKKNLLSLLLATACTFSSVITLNAQSINVVPNPNSPGIFAWTGSGSLSGYAGAPVILNNSLILEYNATGTSDQTQIKLQLAVYNGGNSFNIIANPDAGQGVYFQSIQIVFNNKLFFIYLDVSGIQRLASFDGIAITLYPNPDGGLGYLGSPRILNNTLYVAYSNVSGVTQFGTFNGNGITLIPNPDNSSVGFFNNYSVVFNNTICSRYVTAAGPKQLAIFNGTQWTLLPNPDNTTRGVTPVFPAVYNSKLYFYYYSATNQYQYLEYDGINNPTLIANPQNSSVNNGGVIEFPLVLNGTLFFQYYDITNVYRLAKFDGTTISLVPNPDASPYGFYNTPLIYNNNLYIIYRTADQIYHLTQYLPASNSLNILPNPDGGPGYWDQKLVYGNNLFFQYYNASSVFQLGYFDGSTIKLIANPPGVYNGASGNNAYTGFPLVWNNILYMQYGSVPYGNAGNLAFFDGSTLPITLLNFTVEKNGNTSLLQWNVASEINNNYFSVEHSTDGTNFQEVGKVAGHGTVSTEQKYQFADNNPVQGLNFYRLKQVDYDGRYTYSNIASLTFTSVSNVFKVFPNPAIKNVIIAMPLSVGISIIKVYDFAGKKVMEKQISANSVSEPIDVRKLSAGVYQFTLVQGTQRQSVQVIKK